jgi:biotin synthase
MNIHTLLNEQRQNGWTVPGLSTLLAADAEGSRQLYQEADHVRHEQVGDAVWMRGIIEFSNICRRACAYCGIRSENTNIERYRMTPDEMVELTVRARGLGYGTVVLQSGEDPWFTCEILCDIIRRIRERSDIAVTLSIGERPYDELVPMRAAGADRYLLRFETSDRAIFKSLHPDDDYDERMQCLDDIRRAGFQVGSGFMIGLPGGTLETIARDLLFTRELSLDMIGCGPYLSHPETPLADAALLPDREVYFRTISLLRLMNPRSHIPATTAFDALCEGGRDRVLQCGANVFMPNATPQKYRKHYQLYPNKPCVDEDGDQCALCVQGRIRRLGRSIGAGRGDSLLTNIKER